MIIDSHSHLQLDDFEIDREACISRCLENDVKKILSIGFNKETNKKALEMHKMYPGFAFNTAGLHPDEATEDFAEKIKQLRGFLKANKVYGIGECGLDYHYTKDNRDIQLLLFEDQIKLSIIYDLPLIIHSRDAIKDTFDLLKKYQGQIYGVLHCYSGSLEMAKEFIKLGFHIGIGGVITFKKAVNLKRVVKEIPLSKILVETDCPFMTPVPYRGKRNESSYVKYVLEEVAKLKGLDLEKAENEILQNTRKVFKI